MSARSLFSLWFHFICDSTCTYTYICHGRRQKKKQRKMFELISCFKYVWLSIRLHVQPNYVWHYKFQMLYTGNVNRRQTECVAYNIKSENAHKIPRANVRNWISALGSVPKRLFNFEHFSSSHDFCLCFLFIRCTQCVCVCSEEIQNAINAESYQTGMLWRKIIHYV